MSSTRDQVIALAESLTGAQLRRYSSEEVEGRLLELLRLSEHTAIGIGRSEHQIWYRGRPCPTSDGFPSLIDCIYKKPELVRDFGRANRFRSYRRDEAASR